MRIFSSLTDMAGDDKKSLLSMGVCYTTNIFNDHLFKQILLLLAITFDLLYLQGLATIVFAIPFVIFSAWAGWLVDRYEKRTILIYTKLVEVGVMLLGITSLVNLNWTGLICSIFIMGIQATFFSPTLNALIPQKVHTQKIPQFNALLKIIGIMMIILSVSSSEILFNTFDFESWRYSSENKFVLGQIIGSIGIFFSTIGFFISFKIRKNPEIPVSKAPFPFLGPFNSFLYTLSYKKKSPPLFLVLICEAFFFAYSFFVLLNINNLGIKQLGLSVLSISFIIIALLIGTCIGIYAASKRDISVWHQYLVPSGVGMLTGVLVSSFSVFLPEHHVLQTGFLIFVYFLSGICAGMYLLPLVSLIQILPKSKEKGKVLALSNFISFSGIILSYFFCSIFDWMQELGGKATPATLIFCSSVLGLLFMFWVFKTLQKLFSYKRYSFFGIFLHLLLALRYRITTSGLESITIEKTTLFLPNHPALIDPFIVYSQLAGYSPRPLVDENQLTGLHGKLVGKFLNAITIPDLIKDGAKAVSDTQRSIHAVLDCLKEGNHVLMYPAGRIYHSSKENVGGKSGVWSLLQQASDIQVVLIRTTGLWGSTFSYGATGNYPQFGRSLLRGFLTILGNLFLLVPKRHVHIEFKEANDLAFIQERRQLNKQLEDFYNKTTPSAVEIPRWFWQGKTPIELPEYNVHKNISDTREVKLDVREKVFSILRQISGLHPESPIYDSMDLGNDLGLDSLMLMEVTMAIEEEYQQSVPSLEMLNTVADCLLLASGQLGSNTILPPAQKEWFKEASVEPLELPTDHSCIVKAFFKHLKHNPKDPLLADRTALRNRNQVFIGALIIAKRLKKLPGDKIGIMMPSVPAAVVIWLASLLAGKTPVFFNWTVGEINLKHCIDLTKVTHIISATPLIERIEQQGIELTNLPVEWIAIDQMAKTFSFLDKVLGLIQSKLKKDVKHFSIPEVAAVLFTSGSESSPKGVPLTHRNLLTNATDIIKVLNLAPNDTVLAMLPPFHSFGLMVGLVIPLTTGFKAVFHPNPTEPALLNGLIRDYQVSLLAMPPTFMNALLEQAKNSDALESVRFAFVGAEKCPEHVYQAFAKQCSKASLCEGYGITECAPAVSVNRPDDVMPGTIGHLLPSLTGVVVKEEDEVIKGRAKTDETGMFLVRGPSVFQGYVGETASPFVEFEGHLWYRTGDLVSMDKTGRLTFHGRLKRFVKIGGEMISLPQIENILLDAFSTHPDAPEEGVSLAVEAEFKEGETDIVLFTSLPITLSEVNTVIKTSGLSLLYSVKKIHKIDAIPLLGSGKTDYQKLKSYLEI